MSEGTGTLQNLVEMCGMLQKPVRTLWNCMEPSGKLVLVPICISSLGKDSIALARMLWKAVESSRIVWNMVETTGTL